MNILQVSLRLLSEQNNLVFINWVNNVNWPHWRVPKADVNFRLLDFRQAYLAPIYRVSMEPSRESTWVLAAADEKSGICRIFNMKLHLPLYELREIGLAQFFPVTNFYSLREKREKILCTQRTRNSLLSRRNSKAQPANVKKWRENRGHVVTLAADISLKRKAKSLY